MTKPSVEFTARAIIIIRSSCPFMLEMRFLLVRRKQLQFPNSHPKDSVPKIAYDSNLAQIENQGLQVDQNFHKYDMCIPRSVYS